MRISCSIFLILAVLAYASAFPVPYAPGRFVYTQPIQLSPLLPMEVRREYTGSGNYWRWGSTRTNVYGGFLYDPDTSYFRYPLFHADYSPTNYINPRYLLPLPATRAVATATAEPRGAAQSEGQVQAHVPEQNGNGRYPRNELITSTGAPPPVQGYNPPDYYQTTPAPHPYFNYNYNYNYGAVPAQIPTSTTTRENLAIDDYWNRYNTPPPSPTTTTEATLRGAWYSNSNAYDDRRFTSTTTTTSRPRPPEPVPVLEAESLVREWESVPVQTQTTPKTTTTTMSTTTTTTTTTTPSYTFETEDEIKAGGEQSNEVPVESEPEEDSDEDDEDTWDDFDF